MYVINEWLRKFRTDEVRVSSAARERVHPMDLFASVWLHMRGDWGDQDEHDREQNDKAIKRGGRLVSRHVCRNGTAFCVVTESTCPSTRVLLAEELPHVVCAPADGIAGSSPDGLSAAR